MCQSLIFINSVWICNVNIIWLQKITFSFDWISWIFRMHITLWLSRWRDKLPMYCQSVWMSKSSSRRCWQVCRYVARKKEIFYNYIECHKEQWGYMFNPSYPITFLECIVSSDCPNGGTNYQCNSNLCECPPQFVVDDDKCGGILPF